MKEKVNIKKLCKKYEKNISKWYRPCEIYKEGTKEALECWLCNEYYHIYNRLNQAFLDLFLRDFVGYIYDKFLWKLEIYSYKEAINKKIDRLDLFFLDQAIDMIWEMIKKGQVCTELFEIEEYDKPRKIVKWGWKLIKEEWWDFGYKKTEINPCEIKDEKKLEKVAEEYKKKMKETIRYLWEKHWRDLVMSFLDIVPLRRCDCYEGEIEIE